MFKNTLGGHSIIYLYRNCFICLIKMFFEEQWKNLNFLPSVFCEQKSKSDNRWLHHFHRGFHLPFMYLLLLAAVKKTRLHIALIHGQDTLAAHSKMLKNRPFRYINIKTLTILLICSFFVLNGVRLLQSTSTKLSCGKFSLVIFLEDECVSQRFFPSGLFFS